MPQIKPKILIIVGPTASGKSDLAVKLSQKYNGEVISADSRQVYKGLDLGTGKITAKEMTGIPHHLLDVAKPEKVFTIADYQKLANQAIKKILAKNKLPIIVGGTGFYIQSITDGLVLPSVKPNLKLRAELNEQTTEALNKRLAILDPERSLAIDQYNRPRIIRAIEIATALGKVPPIKKSNSPYQFIKIGLKPDQEELKHKIKQRLLARMKLGLIEEVKQLNLKGLPWKRLEELGLEYRYVAKYLQKQITKLEMITKLETEINKYAKRQLTWFKRDQEIFWFNNPKEAREKIAELFD